MYLCGSRVTSLVLHTILVFFNWPTSSPFIVSDILLYRKKNRSCVTSLAVVHKSYGYDSTYIISGGWDHRLCVWNLDDGSLQSVFKDRSMGNLGYARLDENEDAKTSEWAADGIITCLQYNPDQNEVAYGSGDHLVYIRKFSTDGTQMPLVNTLQHDAEVTALRWNSMSKQWVTGSDDGTIKIWSGTGMNDLVQTLSEKSSVTCLCIDAVNGAIIVGLQNIIKVFDDKFRLVQTNVGHTDSVRNIIHIPERSQYVSCSWDKTIRIWNEWKQIKKKVVEEKVSSAELKDDIDTNQNYDEDLNIISAAV